MKKTRVVDDATIDIVRRNLLSIEQIARESYDLLETAPPPPEDVTVVPGGSDLQAAINAAQPGDTLELERGCTWTGNYTLPASVSGPEPITLRTSATLPDRRIGLADRPLLAVLRTPNASPALKTAPGASHWRFDGIGFACGSSNNAIVLIGDSANADPARTPTDYVFDRCLIAADVTAKNGMEAHAADLMLCRSSVLGVKLQGFESHAFICWNGPGPLTVTDCTLEAGSCGFFIGGAKPAITGLIPSDILFTQNYVTRPLEMRSQTGWGVKNLFELKNAQRVVARGNVFEHNWPDGQHGYAIVITVRAHSYEAPWTTIRDVLFEYNTVRKVAMPFNILGLDNQTGSSGGAYPSQPMDRVTIRHNLIHDVDRQAWTSPTGTMGSGVFMAIDGAPRNFHVANNTFTGAVTGNILAASGQPIPGFVFTANVMQKLVTPYQTYGVFGNAVGEGNPCFSRYFCHVDSYADLVFRDNVLAGCTPATYSQQPNNLFPTVNALMADFVDPAADNYRLKTLPGGCDIDALEAAQGDAVQK